MLDSISKKVNERKEFFYDLDKGEIKIFSKEMGFSFEYFEGVLKVT
jgi:hypothetical protein